jgi:excisionase family DNA binding protein
MTEHLDTGTPPLLYTIDQARQALGGLSRSALYALLDSGQLRSVYLGRRRLITDDALREFVAALPDEPP